nr:SDR family NAD(P)-dependent oxidoreductase [Micromonospora arborensis]
MAALDRVPAGARGFGRIWAEAALTRGDRVAATARDHRALQDLTEAYGDRVLPLTLDVTDRSAVFDAVSRAAETFGQPPGTTGAGWRSRRRRARRVTRRECRSPGPGTTAPSAAAPASSAVADGSECPSRRVDTVAPCG